MNTDVEDLDERPRMQLPKSPTGIEGFDEITDGGTADGRPTLVCGPAGRRQEPIALHFLVNGSTVTANRGCCSRRAGPGRRGGRCQLPGIRP